MEIGNVIHHPRFGACEVIKIDNVTYTTPVVVIVVKKAIECIVAGQTLCRPVSEFNTSL